MQEEIEKFKQAYQRLAKPNSKLFDILLKNNESVVIDCPFIEKTVVYSKENNIVNANVPDTKDGVILHESVSKDQIFSTNDHHNTDRYTIEYLLEVVKCTMPINTSLLIDLTNHAHLPINERTHVFIKRVTLRNSQVTRVHLTKEDKANNFVGKLLTNIDLNDIVDQ